MYQIILWILLAGGVLLLVIATSKQGTLNGIKAKTVGDGVRPDRAR